MLIFYLAVYVISGFVFLSAEMILIRDMGLRTGSAPLFVALILSVFFLFGALGAKLDGGGIEVKLLLLYSVRVWVFAAALQGMP